MFFSTILEGAVPLFFIAVAILAVGGILLLVQLLRSIPFLAGSRKKQGVMLKTIQALAAGCVLVLGLFLLMLLLFARTYEAFTREEPVARVYCVPVEGLDYDMTLRFVPLEGEEAGMAKLFRLNGDQWAVGGHILRWHPWVNILGLHTGYEITRIQGRYLEAEAEASGRQTAYDLRDSWTETIWRWLYRHHEDIPLVKAVYGNTAYTFPDEDKTFVVVVTHSGFMVAPEETR